VSRVILCIVSSVHRDPASLGRSLIEDTAAKKQPWIGEERVLSNLIKESRRHLLESKIDFVFEEHRRGSFGRHHRNLCQRTLLAFAWRRHDFSGQHCAA
jgi:hypothetical protein